MAEYDFDRPYISQSAMKTFKATDPDVARRYGRTVLASKLSNVEYKIRHSRYAQANNMRDPPSCGRIFDGYVVVRNMGSPGQYETWIPGDGFDEVYSAFDSQPT